MRLLENTEPVIREFRTRDAAALVSIGRCLAEFGWSRGDFVLFDSLPENDLRVVVQRDDPEVPIAYFALEVRGEELYVANMAVAEEHRRRGIGTLALRAIGERAAERGFGTLALHVQEWNLPAQLLYRKAGFRAVEIRHGFYGRQDGYRMVKDWPPVTGR